ncbi:MAG TPA: acyl-CoA dehydrogenase family protein [Candidatus Dormibacteraeota bacterium]|nr:acyl-CoA dehydrogenase family protein [Candidatus Dormibacteraeota bacterium]
MELDLTDTERMLRDTFRGYFTSQIEPQVPAMERGELLPYPLMRQMHQALGLDQMMASMGGGGSGGDGSAGGFDANTARYARTTFTVEMARVSPSFALSYGASLGLFGANVLGKGTPEQAQRFALPVLRCEKIGSWGLTEPGAGSDALRGMKSTARRDGDSYILNGGKTFITNAPYADVFLIYARVQGGELDGSIQPFIVERETPGLTTGPPMKKMGMRGSPTGEVFLDDVRVPADQLLGGGVRQRDHVKSSLAVERGGLSVLSYGIAERCFEIARDYARTRQQFGEPIANYQLVQQRLARMYTALSNCRRIVYADHIAGRTLKESVADVCAGKLYCAEMGTFVAFEAIHILAGNGYMEEYVVERLARDAKLIELGGGTTEMQILTIAREILRD